MGGQRTPPTLTSRLHHLSYRYIDMSAGEELAKKTGKIKMSKQPIIIRLPLPEKELSPNARIHWSVKSKHTKAARYYAKSIAASLPDGIKFSSYVLRFTWKDKRRHDMDNATAAVKAYLDGIADAIGQDDSEWEFDGVRFNEPSKVGACVEIVFQQK